MTGIIYTSPNKEWLILETLADEDWRKVFGNIYYYQLCKFDEIKFSINNIEKENPSNYTTFFFLENKEKAFERLYYLKIISRDEMRYQVSLITEEHKDDYDK